MANALTHSLAAGDPTAFAALYDQVGPRLFATATTMLGSSMEAEDIIHDLFVELATQRQRFHEVNNLEAYLFTSLRHAVSRYWRRRDIHRRALARLAYEEGSDNPDARLPAVPDEALATAIAKLPAAQREVVALKIDGGLTFAEIARVTGTSQNTAASRYRYALAQLRRFLTDTPQQHLSKNMIS